MAGIRYVFDTEINRFEVKKCISSVHSTKPHLHAELSLGLIESGSCAAEFPGGSYTMNANSLLIIPPNMVHKCRPLDVNNWKFRMVYINKKWIKTSFGLDISDFGFIHRVLDNKSSADTASFFSYLENFNADIQWKSGVVSSLSKILFHENDDFIKAGAGSSNAKFKNIKDYITEYYLDNIQLDDLITVSGLSKYHIIRQFEAIYGITPHNYLTALRINHAKELLKKNTAIAETALESGFYDQSHFTKTFREYSGTTPSKYLHGKERVKTNNL